MNKRLLVLIVSLCFTVTAFSQKNLWSEADASQARGYTNARSAQLPKQFRLVKLNRAIATSLQRQAPLEDPKARTGVSNVQFPLPLPDGTMLNTSLIESPLVSEALQSQNASVKTYELTDPASHNLKGRITITPTGITGLFFTNEGSLYISPLGDAYPDIHIVYRVKDVPITEPLQCGVQDMVANGQRGGSVLAGDCQLRTYKLAVAATGEYTYWAGSQANALTYITTLINDVTAIYERDLAIRFTLVTNNSILFTDSLADPYITVPSPTSGSPTATLESNHTTITSAIGSANFDLGIVLNYGWSGGLARLNSTCNNSFKGMAAAGITFGTGSNPLPGPQGPVFTGTVAHEIGHQFSATHSFAANNGLCAGNPTASSAWEPGGGSTIMAYAGTCTGNYYQFNSDLYFHGGNILQISSFAVSSACPVTSASTNTAPVVTVPAASYTIPASTPFRLASSASDANGNTLYHCWEQMDAGVITSSAPSATNTSGPNFRSYPPTTDTFRYFPKLTYLVTGAAHPYEVLPSVSRTMNFQDMVRDEAAGGGCTGQASIAVTTNAASGPFTVTSQSTATTWTANGTNTATITWNVANTNVAPVNCPTVDILFSTDGGNTYPYTLSSGTANDGTENIVIPSLPTSFGRIMVKAGNNIFFNINGSNIILTSSCGAAGGSLNPAGSVTGQVNTAALNLSLAPVYGSVVAITGTLESTDPATLLSVNYNAVGSCVIISNLHFGYDTYSFIPNVTGNYTFTKSSGAFGIVFNLYSSAFDPSATCSNMLVSSGTFNSSTSNISLTNSFTVALTAGVQYMLAVGTADVGTPPLPAAYNITVTPPAGGNIYNSTLPTAPGAGFSYAYVIVDNATGLIKAIASAADLSNGTTYSIGSYTIYGLSYSSIITQATLNSYIGTSLASFISSLQNNPLTLCGNVSSNSVSVNVTAALPAQLLPLKAYKVGNTVLLKWATASEQNTSHFEIWRSADGNNFDHLVGTVAAQGNSNSKVDYQLTDNDPLANWNYYRVKETDLDGQSITGNIARINMSQPFANLSVYPNPVKTTLTVEYITEKREAVQVRLFDSKGSQVYQSNFAAQAGSNIRSIPVSTLAKGVYMLQLTSNSGNITTRFVKE
ncbi:MAG: M12 family metallo-peptidase [Chitinophagaceae bacterium]